MKKPQIETKNYLVDKVGRKLLCFQNVGVKFRRRRHRHSRRQSSVEPEIFGFTDLFLKSPFLLIQRRVKIYFF